MVMYLVKSGLNLNKLNTCVFYKSMYLHAFYDSCFGWWVLLNKITVKETLFPSIFTVVTLIFLAGYSPCLTGVSTTLSVRNYQHNFEHLTKIKTKVFLKPSCFVLTVVNGSNIVPLPIHTTTKQIHGKLVFKFEKFFIVTCRVGYWNLLVSVEKPDWETLALALPLPAGPSTCTILCPLQCSKESHFVRPCGKLLWEAIQVINDLAKMEKKKVSVYFMSQFPDSVP